jgi:hypothetical protein
MKYFLSFLLLHSVVLATVFFTFYFIVAYLLGYNGFSDINTAFKIVMIIHGVVVIRKFSMQQNRIYKSMFP